MKTYQIITQTTNMNKRKIKKIDEWLDTLQYCSGNPYGWDKHFVDVIDEVRTEIIKALTNNTK